VLILSKGSRWMVGNYYWVDLAIVPAMTMLLLAVVSGRPAALVRLLDSRPLERLGSFSYSLYLIQLPIVVAISEKIAIPRWGHGDRTFVFTTVIAGGLSLVGAWLFAKVFESPFKPAPDPHQRSARPSQGEAPDDHFSEISGRAAEPCGQPAASAVLFE
jgi:peptidoglycan/LPS O-acetylase OafA/YrhL